MRRLTMIGIGFAVVMLAVAGAGAADYIGAGKCKMCHKIQYESWAEMAHAEAFEVLEAADQANPECLKCHATGATADLPGVQCEACHGAGNDYKSMKIMKDQEAAIAAGLVIPDEALCVTCHEGAPHDQKPFDFASAQAGGVHEHKQ